MHTDSLWGTGGGGGRGQLFGSLMFTCSGKKKEEEKRLLVSLAGVFSYHDTCSAATQDGV